MKIQHLTGLFVVVLMAGLGVAFLPPVVFWGGQPAAGDITGAAWQWQQTRYSNDTVAEPADPSRYTIIFAPDGTLTIRADCNRGGGIYSI